MTKKLLILMILLLVTVPVFAQSVDTAWVRRYNGPGNGIDVASDLAVYGYGNVYVTGSSQGIASDSDYATIKYLPDGDTAWVRRYNGSANLVDCATDLVIDNSDNVIVTGRSYVSAIDCDYATIKYRPDGDTAWVRTYNGPGNAGDKATAIDVDAAGNIYLTGFSYGGPTSLYDYATIKYYPDGDTAWVRRYNGPFSNDEMVYDMVIDTFGNVYVTGWSIATVTGEDYATIKYDSLGNELWVRRYNGPADSWDEPRAITVDGTGNVYVTGMSAGIGTAEDYATIKYDSNGSELWVRRYDGPGNSTDAALAIAIDAFENVCVTGYSDGIGTAHDCATIRYYPDGDTSWVRRYASPGNGIDYGRAIAVDDSSNVYVVGECRSYPYFLTIKYNASGNTAWRYSEPLDCFNGIAYAMRVDSAYDVYVTGFSYGSGTGNDYATIKYVQFLRGDANEDGQVSIGDVIFLINYLFRGGPPPNPIQAGDANCDGKVSIGDIIYLINYLFRGGPPPCI